MSDETLKKVETCACGGGQSCIVARRSQGAFVFEDEVLREAALPPRKHCLDEPTDKQRLALALWKKNAGNPNSVCVKKNSASNE